jgi:TrmH family RNA methyltransferase
MIDIASSSNAHFKTWKSLLTSKGIKKEGLFLLSGEKLIREFARAGGLEVIAELVSSRGEPLTQAPKQYRLTAELFRELDEIGTHHSLLVVRAPEIPRWDADSACSGLEVFCPLGDPQNLGALLRSAEAFGASRVVLLEEAANPYLPKTLKASAGSSLRVRLERGPSLRELSGSFVALELNGRSLTDYKWKKSVRLLVGEEGPGLSALSEKARVEAISIPTSGVESLNAGVAAGIALFHYRLQNPN